MMNTIIRRFTFLTAAFPHGAYQSLGANQPDLRAPSIKGQLRWWYDALLGDKAAEDRIFGGLKNVVAGGKPGPESSRITLRTQELTAVNTQRTTFMPHKGQSGGEKNAILPGSRYQLSLIPRRDGITPDQQSKLERVLDAWLLLGAVGQRSNRGAGSIEVVDAPPTIEGYEARADDLLRSTKLRAAVLSKPYENEKALRLDAGDFLAAEAFGQFTPFGSAFPRKPSLLKLRAARFYEKLHVVAIWDGRYQSATTLRQGIEILARSKEIGRLLSQVADRLC